MSETAKRALRFRTVDRQMLVNGALDSLLPKDHEARDVEAFTSQLDYSALEAKLKVVEGTSGAPAFRPAILMVVILYGVIRGIYSFRKLEQACESDLAFMWLCGGSTPSYHTFSTFYSSNGELINTFLEEMLVEVQECKLVDFSNNTLDGRKVPANASKDSMHRTKTLTKHREEAEERVNRLKAERQDKQRDATAQEAAQLRVAVEKANRLKAAEKKVKERIQERVDKKEAKPEEARVSETDPDCRKMKTKDGGYVPAYNVQTVTELESGLIVVAEVTDQGSDNGLGAKMVEKAEAVTGQKVEKILMDAGYSSADDVDKLEKGGTKVLMPPKNEQKEKKAGTDPYKPKRRDTKEVANWRKRMGEEEYQKLYKRRAPVAEGTHARQKNRGFSRFRLRGKAKAQVEVLWQALAHNLTILISKKWISEGKICSQAA
jgi:transposase